MGGQTSPAYMAPEVVRDTTPTNKVDMWALGIILYQLVASYRHPFHADNVFAMAMAIKDNELDLTRLSSSVPQFIKDTIKALLKKNPNDRPTAQ